jgi:acetoacetyl-CoA synthetase
MIHGLGGTFVELTRLAGLIRCDGPIYGFRTHGSDGQDAPLASVDAMSAFYVDAMRTAQPHGPYAICGYSFGGVVAVEMARRLRDMGEAVSLLALIEAYGNRKIWPRLARLDALRCRIQSRLLGMLRHPGRDAFGYLVMKAAEAFALARAAWLRRIGVRPGSTATAADDLAQQIFRAESEARDRFTPRHYPGDVLFLKPAITKYGFPSNPALIWRPLSGRLEVVRVSGDHKTMIAQHAGELAAVLSARLKG